MAQPGREDLFELGEGPYGRLVDAFQGVARAGAQADGDRDGLLVVEEERRHRLARDQAVAALGAHRRLDGIAQFAQAVDVAPYRAAGDTETFGQLAARPFAGCLEEGEELEETCRGVGCHAVQDAADIGPDLT
ncbi:hypothetical protein GCM10020256_44430 [Streptomyces thermocoprophilus]